MRLSATWFLALLMASALASHGSGNTAAPPAEHGPAALPRIDSASSLLIVAPHPDDETLCCRTASSRLGVVSAGRLVLGYPDGGLLELLGEHRTTPYTSPTTGASAVPYSDALHPGHPYTGESLERDFLEVLGRVRPNLILAPTPLDAHADHRAAGLLAQTLSARSPGAPAVRYWIVHGGAGWPTPAELMPGIPLTPAPLATPLAPGAFELEPAEEDGKLSALQAYRTQLRLSAPFLLSFVRTNELYSLRAH